MNDGSEIPDRIRRGPANFRIADVKKAVKAVQAAGLKVVRVEIEGGKFSIVTVGKGSSAPLIDDDPVDL